MSEGNKQIVVREKKVTINFYNEDKITEKHYFHNFSDAALFMECSITKIYSSKGVKLDKKKGKIYSITTNDYPFYLKKSPEKKYKTINELCLEEKYTRHQIIIEDYIIEDEIPHPDQMSQTENTV